MELKLKRTEKDFIYVHLFFIISCIILLLIPIPIGLRLFFLVFLYNVIIPLIAKIRNHNVWINLWFFCFLVSIFQIFPDWFLSAELNILVFPEDGLFKIGTVSGYMLGLWTIPLFIIIYIGLQVREKYNDFIVVLVVIVLSLLIFGGSEATIWMIGSWYPQHVILLVGNIALYVLPAEVILGLSSYFFFDYMRNKSFLLYFPISFIIMLLYLGSCSFFYFLIEKIIIL